MSTTAEDMSRRAEQLEARLIALERQLHEEREARKKAEEELEYHREVYRAVVETSPDAISLTDSQGIVMMTNRPGAVIVGYDDAEDIVGKNFLGFLAPEEQQRASEGLKDLVEGRPVHLREYRLKKKDGSFALVEIMAAPVPDAEGRPRAMVAIARDITERKQAEDALRAERDKLTNIFEAMVDGVYIVDEQYDIQYANSALTKDFGPYEGRKCYEFFHGRDSVCPWCKNERVFSGETVRWEWHSDKTGRDYDLIDTPIRNPDGSVFKLEIFRDITEQKQVEEALRDSEEKYRQLFATVPDAVMVFDAETLVFIDVNEAALELYGYTRNEFLRLTHPDITAEPDASARSIEETLAGERRGIPLRYHRKKDGGVFPVEISAGTLVRAGRRVLYGVVRDITDRARAEEALRESEEQFRAIFETAEVGMALSSLGGRFLQVNPAFCRLLGYSRSELLGMTINDVTHPDDVGDSARSRQNLMAGRVGVLNLEKRYVRKDGATVWAHVTAACVFDSENKPVRTVALIQDATEKKEAEKALNVYQKRLRSLASQLSLAEERERRRFATELHDQVGQTLALAQIKLGSLAEQASGTLLQGGLKEVRELCGRAIQFTRTLTSELSPPVLYEFGLEAAVEWLVDQHRKLHEVQYTFEDDAAPKPLEDDVRVLLFIAVRELLTNVVKHSGAKSAGVSLRRVENRIRVDVVDDGSGFDPDAAGSRADADGGFGLFSIRERLDRIGGRLKLESKAGRGTRATLEAPLSADPSLIEGEGI